MVLLAVLSAILADNFLLSKETPSFWRSSFWSGV